MITETLGSEGHVGGPAWLPVANRVAMRECRSAWSLEASAAVERSLSYSA